jgi:hypothetical protein
VAAGAANPVPIQVSSRASASRVHVVWVMLRDGRPTTRRVVCRARPLATGRHVGPGSTRLDRMRST